MPSSSLPKSDLKKIASFCVLFLTLAILAGSGKNAGNAAHAASEALQPASNTYTHLSYANTAYDDYYSVSTGCLAGAVACECDGATDGSLNLQYCKIYCNSNSRWVFAGDGCDISYKSQCRDVCAGIAQKSCDIAKTTVAAGCCSCDTG